MLKVWIPGTSDTTDQGLNNLAWVNDNVTIVDGKLGKSLSFNGSSSRLSVTNFQLTNKWSIALWAKCTSASSGWMGVVTLGDTNDANIQMGVFMNPSGNRMQVSFNGKYNSTLPVQNQTEWNHICATYDGSHMLFYLNGVYVSSTAAGYALLAKQHLTIGAESNNATSGGHTAIRIPFNGQLNDVRIYDDQVLSAEEVGILARGLVLHYPLTKEGFGQDNLVTGSNTNSTSSNYWRGHSAVGGNTATIEQDETGIYCVKVARNNVEQSSWDYLSYDNLLRNNLKPATDYTISFDCKPSVTGSIGFTGFINGNATNYMTKSTTTVQGSCTANKWNHMIFKCTTKDSFDDITVGGQVVYFSRSASLRGTNVMVLFKNIKVEEGVIDTPWIPSSQDTLYSTFGLNNNIVHDISGYKRNGTASGVTYLTDATKGIVSTNFDGLDDGVTITNLNIANILNDKCTISFWIKPDGDNGGRSVYFSAFNQVSWSIEKSAQNKLRSWWNGTPDKIINEITISDGTWQHIAIAKNGTSSIKFYYNGEFKKELTDAHNALAFGTTWRLGRDTRSNDGTPYKGLMSDFRLYATALSAEAIKELYDRHTE